MKRCRAFKSSNDACELVLRLNDYLATAIPNLHQMVNSNMKKNKTLKWLSSLSKGEQTPIIDLAVKQKRLVIQEYRDSEKTRANVKC